MTAPQSPPALVIIAGPNGAGKSTTAPLLLHDALRVTEFVNADTIAAGLSAFQPETVAVAAGKLMLQRLRHLASRRVSFAFETTLASRSFRPWIIELQKGGYHVHLLFLGLQNPELAISRVAERVRLGGHSVPDATIRRRFASGLGNFFRLYRPLADTWQFFDNSQALGPLLIASGEQDTVTEIGDDATWNRLTETHS